MDTEFDPLGFDDDGEDNLDITYLVFKVAGEQYAVPVSQVTEIVRLQNIAPLPDCPHFIKGVMSLRGRVIPVMDMRLRCGLEEIAYNERTVIIVVEVGERVTGLLVEAVVEVIEIPDDQINNAPVANANESMIRGLGKQGDNVVILVDSEKLLFGTESMPIKLDNDSAIENTLPEN